MNVVIVGGGSGYQKVVEYLEEEMWPEVTIWAVASIYPALQSYPIDRVFEIHKQEKWAAFDYPRLGNRLVLPYHSPICSEAHVLPLDGLSKMYGVLFSSTIAWMVAAALSAQAKEITLLGVDMSTSSEYGKQRDGLFFLLGQAKALGVDIHIPTDSQINIFGQQYGE